VFCTKKQRFNFVIHLGEQQSININRSAGKCHQYATLVGQLPLYVNN